MTSGALIQFIHPCGHTEEIDEETLARHQGDPPWDCDTCAAARRRQDEEDAPLLAPLTHFIGQLSSVRVVNDSDEGDREAEARWERYLALRAEAETALRRGIHERVSRLLPSFRPGPPPERYSERLDLRDLLDKLHTADCRLHDALWCGENGMTLADGADAFRLFEIEGAKDRLREEVERRLRRLKKALAHDA